MSTVSQKYQTNTVFYNLLQSSVLKNTEICNEILSESDSVNLMFYNAILVYTSTHFQRFLCESRIKSQSFLGTEHNEQSIKQITKVLFID